MSKTRIIGGALLATAVVFASVSTAEAAGRLDGLYVGGKVGRDTYDGTETYTVTDSSVSPPTETVTERNLSGDGFSGGLFVGYDLEVNRWHLAVEGEFTLSEADFSETIALWGGQTNVSLEARRSFGVTARYGYEVVRNALVYGRAGWVRTKFRPSFGGSESKNGLRLGAGVELAVSDRVSIRGEYNYTDYSAITSEIEGGTITETSEIRLDGHAFSFGVATRF